MTFERTRILYGDAACEKIRGARVAVCGVGAVGSFAVEALARLGVENFELFDFDVFDISNINRQLCALNSTVGKPKVEVQKARILDHSDRHDCLHRSRCMPDDRSILKQEPVRKAGHLYGHGGCRA